MLYSKNQHGLKNKILLLVKFGAIFSNTTWLKNKIPPSVKTGNIFSNLTWLKKEILLRLQPRVQNTT